MVVFDLADERLVVGVPRPAPHPGWGSPSGHGHPDHHLGQVSSVVLGVPEGAEPDGLALPGGVGSVDLEVGRGGGLEGGDPGRRGDVEGAEDVPLGVGGGRSFG